MLRKSLRVTKNSQNLNESNKNKFSKKLQEEAESDIRTKGRTSLKQNLKNKNLVKGRTNLKRVSKYKDDSEEEGMSETDAKKGSLKKSRSKSVSKSKDDSEDEYSSETDDNKVTKRSPKKLAKGKARSKSIPSSEDFNEDVESSEIDEDKGRKRRPKSGKRTSKSKSVSKSEDEHSSETDESIVMKRSPKKLDKGKVSLESVSKSKNVIMDKFLSKTGKDKRREKSPKNLGRERSLKRVSKYKDDSEEEGMSESDENKGSFKKSRSRSFPKSKDDSGDEYISETDDTKVTRSPKKLAKGKTSSKRISSSKDFNEDVQSTEIDKDKRTKETLTNLGKRKLNSEDDRKKIKNSRKQDQVKSGRDSTLEDASEEESDLETREELETNKGVLDKFSREQRDSNRSVSDEKVASSKNKKEKSTHSKSNLKHVRTSEDDSDAGESDNSDRNLRNQKLQKSQKESLADKTSKKKIENEKLKEDAIYASKNVELTETRYKRIVKKVQYFSDDSDNTSCSSEEENIPKNKGIACKKCGTSFSTFLLLQVHIRKMHKISPFKCVICHDSFKNYQEFRNHMKSFHPEVGLYPCDYPRCKHDFQTAKKLRDHKKKHFPYTCKFCKKGYVNREDMKFHVKTEHE